MDNIITLKHLGYTQKLEEFRIQQKLEGFEIGRVVAEHKERYVVRTSAEELDAEITGNLRFTAQSREDYPAVGDWVALIVYDSGTAIIHRILPRFSIIKRQAVGQSGTIQVIAANIDVAFLVQAVDRDFNINRLERYITICNSSRVEPVIVLSKIDLISEPRKSEILQSIKDRIKNILVFAISNETQEGYEAINHFLEQGKTYCMLGSSGVGKSTFLNNFSGASLMRTGSISESTHKGRHVTSHRELAILDNGSILIDNPGMREVGIADTTGGLEITFDRIAELSIGCRFKDCTHTTEVGCLVIKAVETGEIDMDSYENYLKMEREKAHFESTLAEKRMKEKEFGKMMKNYKKDMKNRKQ
jgi:ribosome biogenesis GTPase